MRALRLLGFKVAIKSIYSSLIFLALISTGLVGCTKKSVDASKGGESKTESQKTDDSAAMAVTVAKPERKILPRSIVASGVVVPFEDMQLGVELNGLRIQDVKVDVGQSVRKGQVLLTLDARGVQSGLQQADALLREVDAGVLLAQTNLNRGKELLARKLISQADFEQLTAAQVQATARQATARASRDAARLQVEYATLRAPDDGVISKRQAQPGMVVMAGGELLRLIRGNRLEWRADLSERELLQVKPGLMVKIKDSGGGDVIGRLRAASPGVDTTTRTGTVMFDLVEPKQLRIGAFAEGQIELGEVEAMVVPQAAVIRRDGYAYVFVLDDKTKTAKRLRVSLGVQVEDWIEVLDGVNENQTVIVQGAGFLSDGDRVRAVQSP